MAVESNRSVTVSYDGDINGVNLFEAENNTVSPGSVQYIDLASGANTITKPTGATGVTIHPPNTNTDTITLKGISGDTGISIHITDPTSIGLANSVTTFVLTAGATISAVRLLWS